MTLKAKSFFLAISIVVASISAFSHQALANLNARVAVAVLSYEHRELSYDAEELAAAAIRDMLSKKYGKVFVIAGRQVSKASVLEQFRNALATGRQVDVFLSLHTQNENSAEAYLGATDEWINPQKMIQSLVTEKNRRQLNFLGGFGCNTASLAPGFLKMGFKTYVGHDGTSIGFYAMLEFMQRWIKCRDVVSSVGYANKKQKNLVRVINPVSTIFGTGGSDDELVSMLHFGDNQRLCENLKIVNVTLGQ